MNIRLKTLLITTRQTVEHLEFAESVTFLYGPVGTGKSTVARLIDYCFGGDLERTPAVQQEFVAVQLIATIGDSECTLERASTDTQSVRVTWENESGEKGSLNAPLVAKETPIFGESIYNLSDLLFYLCGIEPIKVRKSSRDPDSPMIRLSFRDIWFYCYLDQTHLDSSFFRLEDPFRGRKSQDAMKFFTGLHSERMSQLETDLYRTIDQQHGTREAVKQIRSFMSRFQLGSDLELGVQIQHAEDELKAAELARLQLEDERSVNTHPTDPLRNQLRELGSQIASLHASISETQEAIEEQRSLRAELITSKIKAERAEQAGKLLDDASYVRCPECGTNLRDRVVEPGKCGLCCSSLAHKESLTSEELEAMRRELNDRIDQIADSIIRRERTLEPSKRRLQQLRLKKIELDDLLQKELARYDSAFHETVRTYDREIATLVERLRSLHKLQEMPKAINNLEVEAGALQGQIDLIRSSIDEERTRLRAADENVEAIAQNFKNIMLKVRFPGVSEEDKVVIDTRTWKPFIIHGDIEWGFWDAGSGGKKTLFNVCYALAVHEAARERGMNVPNLLIIDSPTKNISDDENPELVRELYHEIYRLASAAGDRAIQFLLIDSDIVLPDTTLPNFTQRHLAAQPDAPSLIPYYDGP